MHKFHRISHRKVVKTLAISLMMLIPIAFSGIILTNNSNNNSIQNQFLPDTSAVYDTWTGVGENQTVKTFLQNSSSLTGQTDSFNISVDTSPSRIYSGDFNFTFDSQYNTNYTIEDDTPLMYPASNFTSRDNPNWTGDNLTGSDHLYIDYGSEDPLQNDLSKAIDDDESNYYQINSDTSGSQNVVNMSYLANFSRVPDFDDDSIIGFWYVLTYETSRDVTVDLLTYNSEQSKYDFSYQNGTYLDNDKDLGLYTIRNELFQYVNGNNETKFLLSLNSSVGSFALKIFKLQVFAITALEKEITSDQHIAMEFDLKGNSTVYGFNAWIRTLEPNPTDINLTISLYRANQTAKRDTSNDGVLSASNIVMEPETLISTRNITNYNGDKFTFFAFNEDESGISNDMNVSNYFVVLSTNSSDAYYSITCLPFGQGSGYNGLNDPDTSIDHLFLFSESSGSSGSWEKFFAVSNIYQVDAAPFSINLTRGWIPDQDLEMSIQGIDIESESFVTGIYEETSGYSWGLGSWSGTFVNQTLDIQKEIEVNLDWDEDITNTIGFSVDYSAVIFSMENSTSSFSIEYNEDPVWTLNYTFNENNYPNWQFQKFRYLIPTDYITTALYEPDGTNIFTNVTNSGTDGSYDGYEILNESIYYLTSGNYSLICNSTNYIDSSSRLSTYIQFNQYRWQSRAFMQGDNISVQMKVINGTSTSNPVKTGIASCEIYDVDDSIIGGNTLTSSTYDSTESSPRALTIYNFDNDNIMSTNHQTEKGEYNLLFKWQGDDQVGYRKLPIFLTDYGTNISQVYIDEDDKENVLVGTVSKNETLATNYKLAWFALNETESNYDSAIPYINETINYQLQGFDIQVVSVYMNESLLNPGEDVEINVTVRSLNEHFGNNIKFNAKFTQIINENWVVTEENCSEVYLDTVGNPNDEYTLNWTLTVPVDFTGTNAPIRLNPFKLTITPFVEGIELSSIVFDEVFPFVNQTEAQLEGDVLGYEIDISRSGPSFVLGASREYSVLPGNTTYFMQLYDGQYVSTNTTSIYRFESLLLTDILSLGAESQVVWGKSFTLTGQLKDELSDGIANKIISIEYWNGSQWKNFVESDNSDNQLLTDNNGYFSGDFNSTQVSKGNQIKVRSIWAGDVNYSQSLKSVILEPITYTNQIMITIVNSTESPALRKGIFNTITFLVENTGNSSLSNLVFTFDYDGTYEIADLNLLNQKQIEPDEMMTITYEFTLGRNIAGKHMFIGLNVSGDTIQSNETFTESRDFKMTLIDYSPFQNAGQILITFLVIGIVAFWALTVLYSYKTYQKITDVSKKPETTRRRRRGRYVDVSELKKDEEKEDEDVKTADLDDLLAEEGLDET